MGGHARFSGHFAVSIEAEKGYDGAKMGLFRGITG